MPIVEAIARRIRTSGSNPAIPATSPLSRAWSTRTISGATVNDESSLALTTFYRGIRLISSRIATLPIQVYAEAEDGTSKRDRSAATSYLWRRPNTEMSRVSLWEHVVADIVRGNAYLWVDKTAAGTPAAIWWIARNRVRVGRTSDGRKVYEIDRELPMVDYRAGGEIVHLPNWGDSLVGYDIVRVAREAIALGLSAQEYAARTFADGEVPAGVLSTDAVLTPEQADEIADRWHKLRAGITARMRIAVLGGGAKFTPTAYNNEQMQVAQLRELEAANIATLLGIPPHMVGLTQRSTSWGSGIAEQTQGFVTYTLDDYIKRIETEVDDSLLVRELTSRFLKFDLGGLLRGTTLQRYQAYALGYGRWLSTNDIRRDEDLPPVDGGDDVLAQVNLVPLDELTAISSLGEQEAEPADV